MEIYIDVEGVGSLMVQAEAQGSAPSRGLCEVDCNP